MNVPREAGRLLLLVENASEPTSADELLLFLYRLKDSALILENRSTVISGRSFDSLGGLIYELESRPDETMADSERLTFIRRLLQDLQNGIIRVQSS